MAFSIYIHSYMRYIKLIIPYNCIRTHNNQTNGTIYILFPLVFQQGRSHNHCRSNSFLEQFCRNTYIYSLLSFSMISARCSNKVSLFFNCFNGYLYVFLSMDSLLKSFLVIFFLNSSNSFFISTLSLE